MGYPPVGKDAGTPPQWEGWGTPQEGWGYPPSARWGYPPQNVNRQTPVKTVPSPFPRNTGGKKVKLENDMNISRIVKTGLNIENLPKNERIFPTNPTGSITIK